MTLTRRRWHQPSVIVMMWWFRSRAEKLPPSESVRAPVLFSEAPAPPHFAFFHSDTLPIHVVAVVLLLPIASSPFLRLTFEAFFLSTHTIVAVYQFNMDDAMAKLTPEQRQMIMIKAQNEANQQVMQQMMDMMNKACFTKCVGTSVSFIWSLGFAAPARLLIHSHTRRVIDWTRRSKHVWRLAKIDTLIREQQFKRLFKSARTRECKQTELSCECFSDRLFDVGCVVADAITLFLRVSNRNDVISY